MQLIHRYIIYSIFFILYLTFIFSNFLLADDEKKWGEVSPEFLNMTVYPEDTSAAAVKIFDQEIIDLRVDMGLEMLFTRHFQIKILKEDGKRYANYAISYWHKDHIKDLKAQIIQSDGSKIKIKNKNIFDEEAKDRYKVKKLTFPEVAIGSILEVKYVQEAHSVYELRPWYFHDAIPVVESEIIIQLSPFFSYFFKIGNDPKQLVQHTVQKFYNRFNKKWEQRNHYKATNLPAIKEEPYISSLSNYKAHVNFQIKSVTYPGYYKVFIEDIQTLCNKLLEEDFEDYKKPILQVEKLVKQLIPTQMENNKKAQILFEYARDNFDRDPGNRFYIEKDQDDILKDKKCSDMERNLLLMMMLRAAGFDVKPVIISTLDHGLVNPEIPFLSQYNKAILLVTIDGAYYLFDARDPWITYGQLPPSSLVSNAMLVAKDNTGFLQIPNSGIRSFDAIESNLELLPDGGVKGSSKILGIGYASRDYNSDLYEHKKMEKLITKELTNHLDNFILNASDSNLTAIPSDTFRTEFNFELKNYAELIDDEIYLQPGIFFVKNKNVFASEKREYPVEFWYREKEIETNYYRIGDQFSITELPKELTIENKYVKYHRTVIVAQNNPLTIGFSRQFEIKELFIPVEDYSMIRKDYAKIVDADQEIIVLTSKKY
jgi:hypothetical protein